MCVVSRLFLVRYFYSLLVLDFSVIWPSRSFAVGSEHLGLNVCPVDFSMFIVLNMDVVANMIN